MGSTERYCTVLMCSLEGGGVGASPAVTKQLSNGVASSGRKQKGRDQGFVGTVLPSPSSASSLPFPRRLMSLVLRLEDQQRLERAVDERDKLMVEKQNLTEAVVELEKELGLTATAQKVLEDDISARRQELEQRTNELRAAEEALQRLSAQQQQQQSNVDADVQEAARAVQSLQKELQTIRINYKADEVCCYRVPNGRIPSAKSRGGGTAWGCVSVADGLLG